MGAHPELGPVTYHDFVLPLVTKAQPLCRVCGLPWADPIHHAPAWVVRAAQHKLPAKVATR
jgi:hypothetical protein